MHFKGKKKAISSVTILLLFGIAILAIAGAAYVGSYYVAKASNQSSGNSSLLLYSVALNSGAAGTNSSSATATFDISINDSSSSTTITSVTLSGAGFSTIGNWSSTGSSSNLINFRSSYVLSGSNAIDGNRVTSFVFYPMSETAENIVSGATYTYSIHIGTGKSITGSLMAQGHASPVISIDAACVSTSNSCSSNSGYAIFLRNVGNASLTQGEVAQLYFTDATTGSLSNGFCNINSYVAPATMLTCLGQAISGVSAGDSILIQVILPDGQSVSTTVKAS